MKGGALKPKPDWSRSSRHRFGLLRAAFHPQQSKIISFFKVVSDIEEVIQKNSTHEANAK